MTVAPTSTRTVRHRPYFVTGLLFASVGLALLVPGIHLLTLGGSGYYAIAGAALACSGYLLWRQRPSGVWLYLALLAATIAWALWESGPNGWALLPRINLWILLGLVLLLAVRRERGRLLPASAWRTAAKPTIAAASMAVVAAALWHDGRRVEAAPSAALEMTPLPDGPNARSERYSPLNQITPANVSKLALAWKVRLGMPPKHMYGALQATPLLVDETIYMCNMHNVVSAHDLETGRIRWQFDPRINQAVARLGVCRGVASYTAPGTSGPCATRIISFSMDGRLFAVDARTGRRCAGFGRNGEVSLLDGLGITRKGYYYITAAPAVVRGKVIVGGAILDGQEVGEPSGVIRAFDAVTGDFAWAWDMGRPNQRGMPPPGETFTLGTPNSWAPMTGDEALGLVYVPLGNATPDYVTAHRTAAMNRYSSSVVAIQADTGTVRWSFQTTHRDVWDYDVASPATLLEMPTPGGPRPALIQPTKRGEFFVLDRRTGKPLVATVEIPVPQEPVPGETLSPTQPYPVGMPSFGGGKLTEARMWGLTPFDQLWCRIKFKEARYDGPFTPVGLKPTIVYPGYLGGSEWAGVAVHPERKLLALNVNHFAMYNQMIVRAEADRQGLRPFEAGKGRVDLSAWPQAGTAYATRTRGFLSPLDTPCIQPPFSEIAVVDLTTRKTVWRQPLGTGRDTGPFGIPSMLPIRMGVPAMGGPLVTRSGLIFIGATQERSFRAFDLLTGKLLWQARLPAGAHAVPMSYYSKRSGRQFIVIPASGHFAMRNGQADYLLAYALPQS